MTRAKPTFAQTELFANERCDTALGPGAAAFVGLALPVANELLTQVQHVASASPFRNLTTPGGYRMSVAMTNCGTTGWVSDRSGYRYDAIDPETRKHWPAMPDVFLTLARQAAARLGFLDFVPDACLINRYIPGARLTLHQDRDERDLQQPIVSVSLGLPATFLFGGLQRSDRTRQVPVLHGDVVVWGGPTRLTFHGVKPLAEGFHPLVGAQRVNLTFRKAL